MKTPLLSTAALCLAGWLTGCQQTTDVEPQSLSRMVAGNYTTNAFVNPLFVALRTDQMPQLTVKPETDSTVTLIYKQFSPNKATEQLTQILVQRQGETLALKQAGKLIGSWQWDRVFTSNGMETQTNVLQLAKQVSQDSSVSFTGYRN
jgi:hypothetical protein